MIVKQDPFQRIVHHLLLNYSYLYDPGLLCGKMGGVLFFSRYAKVSGLKHYGDYASELLDDFYERLRIDSQIRFDNGLCGIGWGIEYLVQNQLMVGDTDEILADIDNQVMGTDPLYVTDMSLLAGLGGILYYVVTRINSHDRSQIPYPFTRNYLEALREAVSRNVFDGQEQIIPGEIVAAFGDCCRGKRTLSRGLSMPEWFFGKTPAIRCELKKQPIGILDGLTGVAFKMIQP